MFKGMAITDYLFNGFVHLMVRTAGGMGRGDGDALQRRALLLI